MKKYILKAAMGVLFLTFSSTSMALAQVITEFKGFDTEQLSLYGYTLNYVNMTKD